MHFTKIFILFYVFSVIFVFNTSYPIDDDDDSFLDVTLHFDGNQSMETCNLVSLTVNSTGDVVYLMEMSNVIIKTPNVEGHNSVDNGQRSCLYQQINNNITRIVVFNVNKNKLSGFITIADQSYHANDVSLNNQSEQKIQMILWSNSSDVQFNCGAISLRNKHNSASEIHLPEESINVNYIDVNMDTYYVELYLVGDYYFYQNHGVNSVNHLYEIINYVNALYRPQGIYVLVVGLEVWSSGNKITMTSDSKVLLYRIRNWRLSLGTTHDNIHLITGFRYANSVVGLAFVDGMCLFEYSTAISADTNPSNRIPIAMTVTHEMGHNFGLNHDSDSCSCAPDTSCVMSTYSSLSANPLKWSDCSLSVLQSRLKGGSTSYCLKNLPSSLSSTQPSTKCGNGIVDSGEDCDPGVLDTSSVCCNVNTCKFKLNAICASGQCCNKATCTILDRGQVCRAAKDECDSVEYCNGISEFCSDDVKLGNGVSCDSGGGSCYNGVCGSHDKQCRLLYGTSSYKANDDCYKNNIESAKASVGYCSYTPTSYSGENVYYNFYSCSKANYECGTLHCAGGSTPIWNSASEYYSVSYSCKHVFYNLALTGLRDAGLVPNGAICGKTGKCVNSVCVGGQEDSDAPRILVIPSSMLIIISLIFICF